MTGLVDVFGKERVEGEAGARVQIPVPMVEANRQSDPVRREQLSDLAYGGYSNR